MTDRTELPDLHAAIMNLPDGIQPNAPDDEFMRGFRFGHRAARHAAAELLSVYAEPRMVFCPACFVEVTPEQAAPALANVLREVAATFSLDYEAVCRAAGVSRPAQRSVIFCAGPHHEACPECVRAGRCAIAERRSHP